MENDEKIPMIRLAKGREKLRMKSLKSWAWAYKPDTNEILIVQHTL